MTQTTQVPNQCFMTWWVVSGLEPLEKIIESSCICFSLLKKNYVLAHWFQKGNAVLSGKYKFVWGLKSLCCTFKAHPPKSVTWSPLKTHGDNGVLCGKRSQEEVCCLCEIDGYWGRSSAIATITGQLQMVNSGPCRWWNPNPSLFNDSVEAFEEELNRLRWSDLTCISLSRVESLNQHFPPNLNTLHQPALRHPPSLFQA